MYKLISELLSDQKGGITFTCFGTWHLVYLLLIFSAITFAVHYLRHKPDEVKQQILQWSIHFSFSLYILDFFLMPFAYGEIDLEKLPFHVCTAMCVMCFLSRHSRLLQPLKLQFAMLGLVSNLIYVIYPAGVAWYQIHPLSYRTIQTILFHGSMAAYGIFVLAFDETKLNPKDWRKYLTTIVGMVLWACLGNLLYNGTRGSYSHFFNWSFVVRDPFYLLPENISPFFMPFLIVLILSIAELLVYFLCLSVKKIFCKSSL